MFHDTLAPLRNTQFRRLFAGRLITNAGDSLYFIATMWLVYELTGSEFYTGIAGALVMAPSGFQFLFGPLVDRLPLRRVLVGTQLIQAVLVLVIPAAAAFDLLSVWILLVLIPTLTFINQPVYPAESAALPRILDQEELVAANSLFSVAYQGIDAVFNGIAGVLIATIGAVTLFLVDSLTFVLAVIVFATLQVPSAGAGDADDETDADISYEEGGDLETESESSNETSTTVSNGGETSSNGEEKEESYFDELREGIAFLRGTVIAKLLIGVVMVNFALGGVMAILPAYAARLGGADAYGLLSGAISLGLLAGALAGNAIKDFPAGQTLVIGLFVSAGLWISALATDWFIISAFLFALANIPIGITSVISNTLFQTIVPDEFLGRVSAVLGSATTAMMPAGAFVSGTVAEVTSATLVMWGAAAALALLAGYIFTVPDLRQLSRVDEISTLQN